MSRDAVADAGAAAAALATTAATDGRGSLRMAGSLLLASSVVSAVSLVFLFAMFWSFSVDDPDRAQVYGLLNDILGPAAMLLAVPAMVVLQRLVGPASPRLMAAVFVLGLASVLGITVLQALLVLDVITFEQQVGPVMVVYLGLLAWFLVSGRVGERSGVLPRGTGLGFAAASYLGFPIWAIATGRRLRGLSDAPDPLHSGAGPTR